MKKSNSSELIIPLSDPSEIEDYRKALLGLLNLVNLQSCSLATKQHVLTIYKLLDHVDVHSQQAASAPTNIPKYDEE